VIIICLSCQDTQFETGSAPCTLIRKTQRGQHAEPAAERIIHRQPDDEPAYIKIKEGNQTDTTGATQIRSHLSPPEKTCISQ